MELFANNETVFSLEQLIKSHTAGAPLALTIQLAWHLRQRDTTRALQLCNTIEEKLNLIELNHDEKTQSHARMLLIRAESNWLKAKNDDARTQLNQALQLFSGINDHCGQADSYWLSGLIESDTGNIKLQEQQLDFCLKHAQLAQDLIRSEIAGACIARHKVLKMRHADEEIWVRHIEGLTTSEDQGLLTWVFDFLGVQALHHSDFATAANQNIRASDAALQSGQTARAIIISSNICYSMACLGDTEASLKWGQRALQLARSREWPFLLAISLRQTAEALRKIDQLDSAKELLNESLQILNNVPNSRNYVIVLRTLADIALAQSDYRQAYDYFHQMVTNPIVQLQLDLQCLALRGQAQSLLNLNDLNAALASADAALQIAISNNYWDYQISALWVLADIFSHPDISRSTEAQHKSCIDYLLEAVAIGEQIQDYTISDKLYARIAAEYARRKDYSQAYSYSLLAFSSREKRLNIDIANSAVALQLRLQTEKAISEKEHHKAMVEEKERRTAILEQANETLSILGNIGQEITTQLKLENIYQVLLHHVHALLDATHLSIMLLDSTSSVLTMTYGMEAGDRLDQYQFPVDSPIYYSSRCVRERREILVEHFGEINTKARLPGTMPMETLLFSPLIVGDRVIGVMSVQSPKRQAYQERERLIFRTLSAYSAIALDNAYAYTQLMDARHQLVDREKMAALGSLVAGVAHEMNTPIGNSLLIASTISERTKTLLQIIENQNLKRTELLDYLHNVNEGSKLMLNGLTSAATMLNSFKQVAVDRNTEHKRVFNLNATCQDIAASMRNRVINSGHDLQLDIPDDLELNSYPGPLGQVVINLIENALLHGFDKRLRGKMKISAEKFNEDQVRLQFIDDGNGISEKNIRHIFEPFFSTRFGQGGSGLGLSISYNIVTSILHGQLNVKSKVGEGACFTLLLPMEAPDIVD
ncbi:ATP-binding protein [Undibacterium sp. SXout20W]|uniref:ATP-binding protein n=1 Tax=Undibacterium sp. SXout20W TaxID=3413051 RepID=UPI003BF20800